MHSKRHLQQINTRFTLIVFTMVSLVVAGTLFVEGNVYFSQNYLTKELDYLKYALTSFPSNGKNLLANAESLFREERTVAIENIPALSVPVLVYHGILDNPDAINLPKSTFAEHMFALKQNGWQTVTLDDLQGFLEGDIALPDKSFLLTFDDARKDSYYPVDPILQTVDYNAVMFAIARHVFEKNSVFYLSNSELKLMQDSGRWNVQSHGKNDHDLYPIDNAGTLHHFMSNRLWLGEDSRFETEEEFRSRVYEDMVTAKRELEKEFENKMVGYAYPFGDFGQESKNYPEAVNITPGLVASVYPLAFYQVWAEKGSSFNYPDSQEYNLVKRIKVEGDWSAADLLAVLEKGKAKSLPYEDGFRRDNGWVDTWGNVFVGGGKLETGSNGVSSGGSVFLDGTYSWKDYRFTVDLIDLRGSHFSLLAGYKDTENNVACHFSNSEIVAEELVDNERKKLGYALLNREQLDAEPHELFIELSGGVLKCGIDKQDLVVVPYEGVLAYGGVGMKTWDKKPGTSWAVVRSVVVEPLEATSSPVVE